MTNRWVVDILSLMLYREGVMIQSAILKGFSSSTILPDKLEGSKGWEFLRRPALGLFLFSMGVFLLTVSGRGTSSDGSQIFYTVQRVLLDKEINIDPFGRESGADLANDGHYYSKYAPGLAIAEVPVFLGLQAFERALHLDGKPAEEMLRA